MNTNNAIERAVLTILGLVLVAAGGYALLRGLGTLDNAPSDDPLISHTTHRFLGNHEGWFWLAGALAAALSLALGLQFLRHQLTAITRPSHTSLVRRSTTGTTRVAGRALTNALETDLENLPDIQHANTTLTRARPTPRLEMRLQIPDDADFARIRASVEDHALERFRHAIDTDTLDTHIQLKLTQRHGPTVR